MTFEQFHSKHTCRVTELKASAIQGGQVHLTLEGANGLTVGAWVNQGDAPRVGDVYEVTLEWVERGPA